jgi:diguanylate cyclase (GGDEF)-like protein
MTQSSHTTSSTSEEDLQRNLLKLLLRQMPLLSLANLTLGAAATFALWQKLPHNALSIWLISLIAVTATRWSASTLLRRAIDDNRDIQYQTLFFSICSLLTGLCWGLLCFYCVGTLGLAESVVPLLATAGLVAGASTGTSSVVLAFVFYCLAGMLPITAALLLSKTQDGYVLAAFSMLHLVLTLFAGRTNNRLIKDKLQQTAALEQANIRANALAEHLRHLSSLDQVTDLANRRGFDQALDLEWRRAQRHGQPLCLLLCDIDFFKHYNDSLGHQAGDRCLYQVAQALRSRCARAGDVVARFGGEEFAIIAPNTSLDQARVFAEIICATVTALNIPHPDSAASKLVTITVGGAVLDCGNYDNPAELIEAADRSMYRAKSMGRNRALVSPGPQWRSATALAS